MSDKLNEIKKEFKLKDGIRYKPLEYVCEDLSPNMLEEIKTK